MSADNGIHPIIKNIDHNLFCIVFFLKASNQNSLFNIYHKGNENS